MIRILSVDDKKNEKKIVKLTTGQIGTSRVCFIVVFKISIESIKN